MLKYTINIIIRIQAHRDASIQVHDRFMVRIPAETPFELKVIFF